VCKNKTVTKDKLDKTNGGGGSAAEGGGGGGAIAGLVVLGLGIAAVVWIVEAIIAMLPYLITGGIILAVAVISYKKGGFKGMLKGTVIATVLCLGFIFGVREWNEHRHKETKERLAVEAAAELESDKANLESQKKVSGGLLDGKKPFKGSVGGPFSVKEFYGNPAEILAGKKEGRQQDVVINANTVTGLSGSEAMADVQLAVHRGGVLVKGTLANGETDPNFQQMCLGGIDPLSEELYLAWGDCRRMDGYGSSMAGVVEKGALSEKVRKTGKTVPSLFGVYRTFSDGKCDQTWEAFVISRNYLTQYSGGSYVNSHVLKDMKVKRDGSATFTMVYDDCSGSLTPLAEGRTQLNLQCNGESDLTTLCPEEPGTASTMKPGKGKPKKKPKKKKPKKKKSKKKKSKKR